MRGFIIYMAAGTLAVLVMNIIAPPSGFEFDFGTQPALGSDPVIQSVDRTHKNDRLTVPKLAGERPVPAKPPAMLVGCDPAFSPLTPAARANFPARCIT